MSDRTAFEFFRGNSLSDLFAADTGDKRYALLLNYPATAKWAAYPNTRRYFLQDGSSESTKTSFDKICQKEPWKNLSVLGETLPGIAIMPPPKLLFQYWREHLGHSPQLEMMNCSTYLDDLGECEGTSAASDPCIDRVITLFPFDRLRSEKHAVNPDTHYRLLSKATLGELGIPCPSYKTYSLSQIQPRELPLPEQFPYLIKTSHGLSGEGTYIIRSISDRNYCLEELEKYQAIGLLETVIVSEFVKHEVNNYCVQFYVSRAGEITLVGVTQQLVDPEGNYQGGLVDYTHNLSQFIKHIEQVGRYAHQQGYFGIIGVDMLEDKDGQLFAIDANFRINGSTPLCLQRHEMLALGKTTAKYSSDYRMEGTLDTVLTTLEPWLARKDFLILSALEKVKYGNIYTEIYGIVSGETLLEMQQIEQALRGKGLHLTS